MIAADLIAQVRDAGGQITADGADLVLTAPRPLPPDLLDQLKAHKADLLAALPHPDPPVSRGLGGYAMPPGVPPLGDCELARQIAAMPQDDGVPGAETPDPDALWWRVSITEPGGQTVEVDAPAGASLADWQAYAARYHGPGCTVTPLAALPEARAPVPLDEALRTACAEGITPEVFRALLSPEDLQDIGAGDIPVETLRGYAESFAEGLRSGGGPGSSFRPATHELPSPGRLAWSKSVPTEMRPRRIAVGNGGRGERWVEPGWTEMRPRRIAVGNALADEEIQDAQRTEMRPRRIAVGNGPGGTPHGRPLGGR